MVKTIFNYLLVVSAILVGGFFIYKGITKHWLGSCKVYDLDSTIPIMYQQVITAFCESGFFKMIGFFQIVGGILFIIPKTRLLGALVLLPIIFNIFTIHLFLDNRPEELIISGIPLALTFIVALTYLKPILFFYKRISA